MPTFVILLYSGLIWENKSNMNKKIDAPQLYKTAIEVFARYGYNRTRMGDISAALDLAAGTIYRYVSDKKDLYQKSVAYGLEKWQETGRRAVAEYTDPLEQLVVLVFTGYQYLKKDATLLTIMNENPDFLSTSPADDQFYEINKESIEIVKEILTRGINSGCFRKIDSDSISESFFSIYMLFITKIFIKKEGARAWAMVMNGFEIILQGILHRRVAEDTPMKLLKKHQSIIAQDF